MRQSVSARAANEVEPPGRNARRAAVVREDFEGEPERGAGRRTGERRAIALLHDHAHGAWRELERRERAGAAAVRRIGEQRQKRGDVRAPDDGPQLADERRDCVRLCGRLRGCRREGRRAPC